MSSTGSLLDSVTLSVLGSDSDKYGKVRLYGSLFWGISSFLSGIVIEHFGIISIVPLFSGFLLAFFFAACFIVLSADIFDTLDTNVTFPSIEEFNRIDIEITTDRNSGNHADETLPLLDIKDDEEDAEESIFSSLAKPNVILFFATTALVGTVFSIIAGFLFIYYSQSWKASPALLGMSTPASILNIVWTSHLLLLELVSKKTGHF